MEEKYMHILSQFPIAGNPVSCQRYGQGHINETYLVVTDCAHRYILQRINDHIFKDVAGLMANIVLVTEYLRRIVDDPRETMTVIHTHEGKPYYCYSAGYYRLYDFVEGSLCLQAAETEEDFYQSAVGFGRFQQLLRDFPAHQLTEPIANFHNTIDRYRIFKEVLDRDPMGRAKDVRQEIDFVLSREEEAGQLHRMRMDGTLPLRVTHNDTKLNNVLLDEQTRKALCVIDLDTIMPGLSLYDFGDSIRFGAATAAEDEKDLSKVGMSLELFRTYTRGFLSACPGLTDAEVAHLPLGAKTMTLECGVRFLTDYLDGDHYFAVHREGHNLDRARTQFKLVQDMEEKWEQMQAVVREERAHSS
ncbi:MAG: aminoglycoside phosphotransferase family protein [Ruminococcaceae bacterium]|nr:aminoglycoside phosphotransferase family protein [Oscillospiraceae bacterium]